MKKIFCNINKCIACKACQIACAVEHSRSKNLLLAFFETPKPRNRRRVETAGHKTTSEGCQHCVDAPCVDACIGGALTKDPSSGETKFNYDKCVACWMCVMACPFGVIVRDAKQHKALKCDLCPDRDDYACVAACPTRALYGGEFEEFKKKIKR